MGTVRPTSTARLPGAVIGAGPVGLAAAARLVARGEPPLVLGPGAQAGAVRLVSARVAALDRTPEGVPVVGEEGRRVGPVGEIVAVTGFRPGLSPLREPRLSLDPATEARAAAAPRPPAPDGAPRPGLPLLQGVEGSRTGCYAP